MAIDRRPQMEQPGVGLKDFSIFDLMAFFNEALWRVQVNEVGEIMAESLLSAIIGGQNNIPSPCRLGDQARPERYAQARALRRSLVGEG